jgi:hypothetical protein
MGARAYAFIGYSADYGEGRLAECLTQLIELLTDLP